MSQHIRTINELLMAVGSTRWERVCGALETEIERLAAVVADETLHACFRDLARFGGDWVGLYFEAYYMLKEGRTETPMQRLSLAAYAYPEKVNGILWASAIWRRAFNAALSGREAVTL
jgi:hypothetical protein